MKNLLQQSISPVYQHRKDERGSVLLVVFFIVAVLMVLIGVTLTSTTNKYFTAYQWASWQEALQGAESGADITMAEMRKDIQGATSVPWVGWKVGTYATVNGKLVKDASSEHPIDSTGYFSKSGGSTTLFNLGYFTNAHGAKAGDYATYSTQLTPHAGEGNNNLRITTTVDAPVSLTDPAGRQWIRVRSSGSTDLSGPVRVSEERLDNRLRKLGFFFDKVLNQSVSTPVATRQIELIAKPVSLFSGAITTMVQFKDDGGATVTDSFNSEDPTHWPINAAGEYDLTISHDPTSPLGKNGDIASNAFPIKHDHSENLDIKGDTIWGDVGNNYSQIKGIDSTYYGSNPQGYTDGSGIWHPYYGLNNENYGTTNPTSNLIKTDASADISGNIATNYYRDLPAIPKPNWNTGGSAPNADVTYSKVDKATGDVDLKNYTDPNNPYRIRIGSFSGNSVLTRGGITLAASDKWVLKSAPKPGGWTTSTPTIHSYVEIWVTGDIKLDDGGTIVLQQQVDGSGKVISDVSAVIYFDRNIKIGETKETKTNAGGFDNQSDDAKNLVMLGVTEPDGAQKLPKDSYIDPVTLAEWDYTPYKATGNILFKENDFTGAIYAPDHNIVFDNSKDYKGKRKKRKQDGNDFYGSFVGRTLHSKKAHNYHFDESLNDAGLTLDWGYISWFEDVDVDNR